MTPALASTTPKQLSDIGMMKKWATTLQSLRRQTKSKNSLIFLLRTFQTGAPGNRQSNKCDANSLLGLRTTPLTLQRSGTNAKSRQRLSSTTNFKRDEPDYDLICNTENTSEGSIADGTVRNWFPEGESPPYFASLLARYLLVDDGKDCAAMKYLSFSAKDRLRMAMAPAVITPRLRQDATRQ
jgi:hypothetical protein